MQNLKSLLDKLRGDPFQILQCDCTADFTAIKKNYRQLALKYHPDRNKEQQATDMFIKINEAYEFLQDDTNRQAYVQHFKALQENKQKMETMSEERKQMVNRLRRNEQEYQLQKKQRDEQIQKRKAYFQAKMEEEQQREELRREIAKQINPQQYYDQVSSVVVSWENGLSFTQKLLEKALGVYGGISNIMIESKRRKAVVTFASIEKATLFVETFRHPMMYAEFTLEKEKRNKLLKALQVRKNTQVDLTLNTDTISRLKELFNRKSNLYQNTPVFKDMI